MRPPKRSLRLRRRSLLRLALTMKCTPYPAARPASSVTGCLELLELGAERRPVVDDDEHVAVALVGEVTRRSSHPVGGDAVEAAGG